MRLRDLRTYDGGSHTGDQTTGQVDTRQLASDQLILGLARRGDKLLLRNLKHCKLGHRVRNLLEQDRTETSVETGNTFFPCDSGEATGETVGERGLGDESDSGGFERAKGDVGEEFGDAGRSEVDCLTVLSGRVDADGVDGDLFPEFVTARGALARAIALWWHSGGDPDLPSELQGSLDGVSEDGGTETGQQRTGTFSRDNLSETTDHSLPDVVSHMPYDSGRDLSTHSVVHLGLELDSGLDDIDGRQCTVGNSATKGTSERKSRVQVDTGRVGRDRVLGGLLQVLDPVVCLVLELGSGLLGLGGGIVDLVSDGGDDKVGRGGCEEGVGNHFER